MLETCADPAHGSAASPGSHAHDGTAVVTGLLLMAVLTAVVTGLLVGMTLETLEAAAAAVAAVVAPDTDADVDDTAVVETQIEAVETYFGHTSIGNLAVETSAKMEAGMTKRRAALAFFVCAESAWSADLSTHPA